MSDVKPDTTQYFAALSEYRDALIEEARAIREEDEARVTMEACALNAELRLINEQGGGDPKKLGPTESDRKRAHDAFKEVDKAFSHARQAYFEAKAQRYLTRGMSRICDLRAKAAIVILETQAATLRG